MKFTRSGLLHSLSDIVRKGWTNQNLRDLVDSLWREPFINRTSGFNVAGGPDSVISFDNATRTFTIAPAVNKFGFWQFVSNISYFKRTEAMALQIPDEEGLYIIYFSRDETDLTRKLQKLFYIKNPSEEQRKEVYLNSVIVAQVYWDAVAKEAICVCDDRHGSEINPQLHWIAQFSGFAKRFLNGGLTLYGYVINGDGSGNSQVDWKTTSGKFWHTDFLIDIPDAGETTYIPVLAWNNGLPRITTGTLPVVSTTRLNYNSGGNSIIAASSGKYVMYHAFATNDKLAGRHVISVMGRNQYETLADAFAGLDAELLTLFAQMPQSGKCYLSTLFYEVDDAFANTVKARMVSIAESVTFVETQGKNHSPVTIANDSKNFLSVTNKQVISLLVDNLPGGADGREVELSTNAGYVVWRYVGEVTWNNIVSLASLTGPQGPQGPQGIQGAPGQDGAKPVQVAGKTLTSAGWTLNGGLYEQNISDANITATSYVEVIPDNAGIDNVIAAIILPMTDSSAGNVKVYAKNAPTANIGCTINIYETA